MKTIEYFCGHTEDKLMDPCHFARNDPFPQCFGVKVIRETWCPGVVCKPCITAMQAARAKAARRGGRS